jgi:hypothetical protein
LRWNLGVGINGQNGSGSVATTVSPSATYDDLVKIGQESALGFAASTTYTLPSSSTRNNNAKHPKRTIQTP